MTATMQSTEKCGTIGCDEPAEWIPVPDGNRLGSKAKRRCRSCCDAIRVHDIPAGGLWCTDQLRPWAEIDADYRQNSPSFGRLVLALTERGTSLVPWYGPVTR